MPTGRAAKTKIRVGVLAGGASAERHISLTSGAQIAEQLPKDRYEVVLLDPLALMVNNPALDAAQRAQARELSAGGTRVEVMSERDRELPAEFQRQIERTASTLSPATRALTADGGAGIDVAFIALHGPWGEDGRIQGLLDLIGVPYTGSGVLASALAMDKAMAKTVLLAHGIDVPEGIAVRDAVDVRLATVEFPVVVKPVRNGSSFGVTMVERADDLPAAIVEALRFDDRALVEERLGGVELTVGVIGNDVPEALPVVEIVPKRGFFDYRAKYDDTESDEICPARIPPEVADRARDAALRAHVALGCRGLSRTDFIWEEPRLVALEVNTMPGMTSNSLLPKAAAVAGISFPDLVQRILALALEDADRTQR